MVVCDEYLTDLLHEIEKSERRTAILKETVERYLAYLARGNNCKAWAPPSTFQSVKNIAIERKKGKPGRKQTEISILMEGKAKEILEREDELSTGEILDLLCMEGIHLEAKRPDATVRSLLHNRPWARVSARSAAFFSCS